MIARLLRMLAFAALLVHAAASAHKPSDSYLTLAVDGATINGQWDIALRDLDFALGLDGNQDGAITWGEVKAKHADIAAYALARLTVGPAHGACEPVVREQLIDNHSDGAYAVLRFTVTCAAAPKSLAVGYRLFFDVDPQHRGLLNLSAQGASRAGILSVDAPVQQFVLAELSRREQFADYLKEGVLHIWMGFDHVLFLLSLLLPAVLVRSLVPGATWTGAPTFRHAFWDVFRVVTAFTVAHSITLSLAALGVVSLPSRLVESAIAASVVLAALNNVRPVVFGGRWIIAFAFGLIHGFGFASVLADLGLPRDSLLLALVAFNVGVELGQLAIVAVFLPIAYALRDTWLYRRVILAGGSLLVAALAALWLAERAFDTTLLPALKFGT
ncbi:MAG: HupE/UreJ family protein [Betaproteobacteria bacterium]